MDPRSLAEQIERRFVADQHKVDVLAGPMVKMFDDLGIELPGIMGRAGAWGTTVDGHEFGADLIEMQPGSAFPLHVHAGDHLLFIVSGRGFVHIDGEDHPAVTGDTFYIAAEHPHGVKTDPDFWGAFAFLACGIPHKHITAHDRMTVLRDHEHEHPHPHFRHPEAAE
jgi:quercetin dioxygenase-like cupin family protein